MKTSAFILLTFLGYGLVYSNSNTMTIPTVNQSFLIHQETLDPATFNPGAGGENISWIMDNIQSSTSFNVNILSISQFLFTGTLKDADLVIENEYLSTNALNFGHEHYFIYEVNDNALIKVGRIDTDTVLKESYTVYFSDPELRTDGMIYYNQTLTDNWAGSYIKPSSNETVDWSNGKSEYLVDATGDLRIYGMFLQNVYRIKRVKDYTETINSSKSIDHHIESYEWWSEDMAYPIVTMQLHTATDSTNTFTVNYLDKSHYKIQGVNNNMSDEFGVNVYPNPSNGQIEVTYDANNSTWLNIELFNATGSVIRTVESKQVIPGKFKQNYSLDVPPGVYFVKTTINGRSETKKLIIT